MPRPASLVLATAVLALQSTPVLAQSAPPPSPLPGLAYDLPFFPGATHDAAIPTPDDVLGYSVGSKPATHAEIEAVIKAIAAKSPRTRLFNYATSHEGRALSYLVITSQANIQRLDAIKADLAKLADPRSVSQADGDQLAATLPAVAWMAYCIHGDEMTGSDASLALAWHLASCVDEHVVKMLDETIVVIDPLMNPDGRDRWLAGMAQNRTAQPSVDDQSLLHSGFWPSGRMNHYLFDLNRDWIFATQPESKGRIRAIGEWNPHFFVESHEMGSLDTFLMSPGRDPVNPHMPANVSKWIATFAKEHGAAFDRRGWRYYTGEWNEEWYPGYSGSWTSMRNIIGNLYEQASIGTDAVRRPEGTLEAYREGVHHQLVASIANIESLYTHRRDVLKDYLAERRANVATAAAPAPARTFAITPSANQGRLSAFLDLMTIQKFEMFRADKEFTASGKDRLGNAFTDRAFPAETILIPQRQPEARLIATMLEFDPRMPKRFLEDERRELLRFGNSKLYDITGWSIPMLQDVECFELAIDVPQNSPRFSPTPRVVPMAPSDPEATVAFIIDGADDRSVAVAGRLLERGVQVRASNKPFRFADRDYPRGSVVITRIDNRMLTGDLAQAVGQATSELGIEAVGVSTGWGDGDLPDLGGEHFVRLEAPRIAVLGRDPFGPYSFGETWHLIDRTLGVRASFIDFNQINGTDLRRYNVIILPSGGGRVVGDKLEMLKTWVESGGTLIAVGSSAGALAKDGGIGSTRLLPAVLTKLDDYRMTIVREWEGQRAVIDEAAVWSQQPPAKVVYPWTMGGDDKASDDEAKRRDAWRELFMPQGAILAGRVDDRSWLTGGCGEYVPIIYQGDNVLMTAGGAQAPVRLGVFLPAPPEEPKPDAPADAKPDAALNGGAKEEADKADDAKKDDKKEESKPGWATAPPGFELRLRMSGLLWPEAADRIANSAYVTRESVGRGQVILFASSPTFRAAALGTSRIFSNAIILGPGMGASHPIRP